MEHIVIDPQILRQADVLLSNEDTIVSTLDAVRRWQASTHERLAAARFALSVLLIAHDRSGAAITDSVRTDALNHLRQNQHECPEGPVRDLLAHMVVVALSIAPKV